MATANPRHGYLLGLTAYVIWGLFPLYFKAIQSVPALEIIVHRVLWSALFGGLLLLLWKHPGWWRELRDHPKRLAVLAGCGLLLATNWLVYVWAVNNERLIEASLGYYINPLIYVLVGVVFFRERLRRLQSAAVVLAAAGVAVLTLSGGQFPLLALTLATSFTIYGVIRRRVAIGGMPGLFIETLLLLPAAVGYLLWLESRDAAVFEDLVGSGGTDHDAVLGEVELQGNAPGIDDFPLGVLLVLAGGEDQHLLVGLAGERLGDFHRIAGGIIADEFLVLLEALDQVVHVVVEFGNDRVGSGMCPVLNEPEAAPGGQEKDCDDG